MSATLTDLTASLAARRDLNDETIAIACQRLLDEEAPLAERADFLRALHAKGETPSEIAGFVRNFLRQAKSPGLTGNCLDVCGTGGDKAGLFNVSTAVMFNAAACGARVVKHGNRGITSQSGGADVLEALDIRLDLPAAESLEAAGCAFLFAPRYHPAFKAIVPVRKSLAAEGTPSIFNIIGPLLNPALPDTQIAGVFNPDLLPVYAEVFRLLGRRHAWVAHGAGGLDEVSLLGPTKILATRDGLVRPLEINPADVGLETAPLEDLRGGSAAENATLLEDLFAGRKPGPCQDMVTLNTACALVVAGLAPDLPSAHAAAVTAITEGRCSEILQRLRQISRK